MRFLNTCKHGNYIYIGIKIMKKINFAVEFGFIFKFNT